MSEVTTAMSEGWHAHNSPLGRRLQSAGQEWWQAGFDGCTASGLTLLDHGTGRTYPEPLYGFTTQDGRAWVAVFEASEFESPAGWAVIEVTGRYEDGLAEAVGQLHQKLERQFHLGPRTVTNAAKERVLADLGERWAPAYVETSVVRSEEGDGDIEWDPTWEYVTLHSVAGDVLVEAEMLPLPATVWAADAARQTADAAGWLTALTLDTKDATTIRTAAVRIPVAVTDPEVYAEWLGKSCADVVPVVSWLSAGGLRGVAAVAAYAQW